MNKYLVSFVLMFAGLQSYATVYGEADQTLISIFNNVNTFYDSESDSEIIVHPNAVIYGNTDVIDVSQSLTIYNYGTINATINTNGYNLFIVNTGTISGGITASGNDNVVQTISSPEQMTNLNVTGGNFCVKIDDYENLNFNDIKNINADSIVISNSSIIIDDFNDWQNWAANVSAKERVTLYINNIDAINDGEIIKHISANQLDNIEIFVRDLDGLHKVELTKTANMITLNIARETSYEKVSDSLNQVITDNYDDKFVSALNNANSAEEIKSIMNASYHFNPLVLMNPIKTINRAFLMDVRNDNLSDLGFGAGLDYIMSDSINNMGPYFYVSDKFNKLYVRLGLNLNKFSYEDKYNDFDGLAYGFNFNARQYISDFWIDGLIGGNYTSFHANNILVNDEIKQNPRGISKYARLNIGYDYGNISDLVITPFGGFNFQKIEILDVSESESDFYFGTALKYSVLMDSMKYKYGASLSVDKDGYLYGGADIGVWFVADEIGASVGADIFQDEFGTNYKLSAKTKMLF